MRGPKPYTPPETLRWLALRSDAETCEALEFAATALERRARPTRSVIDKAIGAARTQLVVSKAIDLGRSLLTEGDKSALLYCERPLRLLADSLRDARTIARSIPFARALERWAVLQNSNKSALMDASMNLFRFAISLEGRGGTAEQNLGMSQSHAGRPHESLQTSVRVARTGRTSFIRAHGASNAIVALIQLHDLDEALRIGNAHGLCDASAPRETQALILANRMVIAALLDECDSLSILGSRSRDLSAGTPFASLWLLNARRILSYAREQPRPSRSIVSTMERLIDEPTSVDSKKTP